LGEVARLTSLNNLLDSVGYLRDIYEDFTDETLQLLKQTASNLSNSHDGGAALLASFNDAAICNAIIMHFRVSTSSCSQKYMA
jgi:ubiquitin thioesterase protein OTUB1